MSTAKVRYALVGVVLVTGLGGFALGQFQLRPSVGKPVQMGTGPTPPMAVPAAPVCVDGPAPGTVPVVASAAAPAAEAPKPASANASADTPATSRRREAVIRAPVGTFVKDMDVGK